MQVTYYCRPLGADCIITLAKSGTLLFFNKSIEILFLLLMVQQKAVARHYSVLYCNKCNCTGQTQFVVTRRPALLLDFVPLLIINLVSVSSYGSAVPSSNVCKQGQQLRAGYRGSRNLQPISISNYSLSPEQRPGPHREGYVAMRASENPIIRYLLFYSFSIHPRI